MESSAEGTKMCPYCGEQIRAKAIKCRHCLTLLAEEDLANPIPAVAEPNFTGSSSVFTPTTLSPSTLGATAGPAQVPSLKCRATIGAVVGLGCVYGCYAVSSILRGNFLPGRILEYFPAMVVVADVSVGILLLTSIALVVIAAGAPRRGASGLREVEWSLLTAVGAILTMTLASVITVVSGSRWDDLSGASKSELLGGFIGLGLGGVLPCALLVYFVRRLSKADRSW